MDTSFKAARIEALSDGVFAIVMTLLILELGIESHAVIQSDVELLIALEEMWSSILAYFLSFMILGIYWIGHHNQFMFIHRSDRDFIWINILFLSLVSMLPFITALLAQYLNLKLPIILYCILLILIGLTLLINWNVRF